MNKATILIVDDDTTNLNILLDYLHDLDYKVLIAPNGEQALLLGGARGREEKKFIHCGNWTAM